jgi:hypothetical protein
METCPRCNTQLLGCNCFHSINVFQFRSGQVLLYPH